MAGLQLENKLLIPSTDEDWDSVARCSIDIRQGFVVPDALREARKRRFDPTKLLSVRHKFQVLMDIELILIYIDFRLHL